MNFQRQRKEKVEIGMTPMIDVVFLLLIFFMVTTTFNRETQLKIKLPQARGQQKELDQVMELTIDVQGNYFLGKRRVINTKPETLRNALRATITSKKRPLLINADGKTPHQSVITALDVAKQVGIKAITFAAKAPPEEKK